MKNWFEIGALHRSDFRRLLMFYNLDYKEDKGWLDSFFVVNGSLNELTLLGNQVDEWNSTQKSL